MKHIGYLVKTEVGDFYFGLDEKAHADRRADDFCNSSSMEKVYAASEGEAESRGMVGLGVPSPRTGDTQVEKKTECQEGSEPVVYYGGSKEPGPVSFEPPAAGADASQVRDLELDMYRTLYGTLAPTGAVTDVLAERLRQVEAEGWTPEHDDEHADGQMAQAAATYAAAASLDRADRSVIDEFGLRGTPSHIKNMWPWNLAWWKPKSRRRDLVKAGALILAEIERIDRAALRASNEGKSNG